MNFYRDTRIDPREFPELAMLLWNRDVARPLTPEEAFELYERNWRYVDTNRMTIKEWDLVESLREHYGKGVLLTA